MLFVEEHQELLSCSQGTPAALRAPTASIPGPIWQNGGITGLQTPHTPAPSPPGSPQRPAGTCLEPGALPPQASPVALPAVARHRRLRRGRHGRGRAGGGSASLSRPWGCLWGAGGLGPRASAGPQLAAGPWASGAGWRKRPERGWQWGGGLLGTKNPIAAPQMDHFLLV